MHHASPRFGSGFSMEACLVSVNTLPLPKFHHVRLIVVGGRRGVCPEAERGDALPDLERVARWERRQLLRRVNEARQLLDGREPPALAPG